MLGGRNAEHKIRNILKHIFTDELCRQISWTGQKGSVSIKDTITTSIITGNYIFLQFLVLLIRFRFKIFISSYRRITISH